MRPGSARRPDTPGTLASLNGRTAPALRLVCLLALAALPSAAAEPPKTLLRAIAANGSLFEKELDHYTYRQRFQFFETGPKRGGDYLEVRDITFNPEGERTEIFLQGPVNRLQRIRMTEEDFRDLRDVQPFVLTEDTLWLYKTRYKGEEACGQGMCFVYQIEPRQILEGQRFLDGQVWVDQESLQVVQAAGQPVPQIYRNDEKANLFARFVTIYEPIDGKYWFPVKTVGDDTLPFPGGAIDVRYEILYQNYKRFSAETTITFDEP